MQFNNPVLDSKLEAIQGQGHENGLESGEDNIQVEAEKAGHVQAGEGKAKEAFKCCLLLLKGWFCRSQGHIFLEGEQWKKGTTEEIPADLKGKNTLL